MPKITEMFAFVVADKDENDEGVMGFGTPGGGMMPMVGADLDRVKSLIPIADQIKQVTGKAYKILHFKLTGEI